jgi:hypothetical protein
MWGPTGGGSCNGCQPETTPTASAATSTTTPTAVNGQYRGWRPRLYRNEIIFVVFRAEVLPARLLLSAHPGNSTSSPEMTLSLPPSLIECNRLQICYQSLTDLYIRNCHCQLLNFLFK